MRFHGGCNIRLAGRPSDLVDVLPEPEVLRLPLQSCRFDFKEICVKEGEEVHPGQALAKDLDHFAVPLLAPRAGTVRLEEAEGHITLVDIHKEPEEPYRPEEPLEHAPRDMDSVGKKRYKLLALGAWQFFRDAYSGRLPNPFGVPSAVIVSTLALEPFLARGDVQIRKRLASFTRGLEHLQSLLEYQPIYLVLPDIGSGFAQRVRDTIRGYAWAQLVGIPLRYGLDHSAAIARGLGLKRNGEGPVWALDAAGALAVDRALTLSLPSTVRIVSLGGPAAEKPRHLKAMPGYPLSDMVETRKAESSTRIIAGGVFTGSEVPESQLGLDAECAGLTLLREHEERELLSFMRPGFDRASYSRCFLSAVRGAFIENLTTALRGERRACVSCGYCEEVCPARIMPYLIHKHLYQEGYEEAERIGVDRCLRCGLCSYVCPSKIELRGQFIDAQELLEQERPAEEVAS